ncbi:hypothetical protein F2P47_09765 [Parvibaculum sedimenti]|uniref:Uncharacterized protein n=1 Tax=Parvibaculum sedimenti TaxID=2608632 RepID=A0A6N6VIN8_9HYPH|nr:hypothetical protein F2P47_09765 [Parvibaculum sedimenti]
MKLQAVMETWRPVSFGGDMGGLGRAALAMALSLLCVAAAQAGAIPEAERADLRREFILANTEFTVLHEVGHVVFQEFAVPLFGREEESADTLATMLMILRYGVDTDPQRMDRLLMVSAEWYDEWQVLDPATKRAPTGMITRYPSSASTTSTALSSALMRRCWGCFSTAPLSCCRSSAAGSATASSPAPGRPHSGSMTTIASARHIRTRAGASTCL